MWTSLSIRWNPLNSDMAVLPILQYPHPILKSRSRKVRNLDDWMVQIIKNLWDTIIASPGVALAAPQIGELYRIIVCDASRKIKDRHHGKITLLNPFIRHREGKKIFREGCLSVPDYTGNVSRSEKVWVEGLDSKGQRISLIAEGLEALALQHEIDHLEGVLFLDRIASISTDLFRRKVY